MIRLIFRPNPVRILLRKVICVLTDPVFNGIVSFHLSLSEDVYFC